MARRPCPRMERGLNVPSGLVLRTGIKQRGQFLANEPSGVSDRT
ncbi:hypothetical protein BN2537_325 [Streptomyces venezuelae]|nr:hypothetical protein BN2537_325 [Streptomyces venezuelae]